MSLAPPAREEYEVTLQPFTQEDLPATCRWPNASGN